MNNIKNGSVFQKKSVMVVTAVIACVFWASAAPVTKLSYEMLNITNEYQRVLLTGLRFMIAGFGILVFQGLHTRKSIITQRRELPVTLLASLVLYAAYIFYPIALGHTNGVKSSVFLSTSVFFVPIVSCLMMKGDKFNKNQWAGVLLGFAGVLVANFSIFSGEFIFTLLGEGFLLIFCLLLSVDVLLARKYANGIDVVKMNGWQYLISGVALTVTGLIGYPEAFVMDAASIGLLIYLGAVAGATYTVWFEMLKYHSASMLEQYKFLVPLVGSLISVVILPNEHIGLEMLLAGLLVGAGVYIVNHQETVKKRVSPPAKNACNTSI